MREANFFRHPIFIFLVFTNIMTLVAFYYYIFMKTDVSFNQIIQLKVQPSKSFNSTSEVLPNSSEEHVSANVNSITANPMFMKKIFNSTVPFFVLGQPVLDSDWAGSGVFGRNDFKTLAVEHSCLQQSDSRRILHSFFDTLLKQCSDDVWTVRICRRPPEGGLSSSSCERLGHCYQLVEQVIANVDSCSALSHIYLNSTVHNISLLVGVIFDVAPTPKEGELPVARRQYFYCYGLPDDFIRVKNGETNDCPPCLCPSVFSGRTLMTQLQITEFDQNIDSKLTLANKLLKNSRFVNCLTSNSSAVIDPSELYLVGGAPNLRAEKSWGVRQLFESYNMPLALEGGTLLGWYRNCSVVADDVDVDFNVPNWALNSEFYEMVLKSAYQEGAPVIRTLKRPSTYYPNNNETADNGERAWMKTTRVFGDMESGVEVRFDVWTSPDGEKTWDPDIIGVDVFVLYIGMPGVNYSYVQGFQSWKCEIMHYALPQDLRMCSTIFLGDLYLVPCHPAPYLESHYGKGWGNHEQRQEGQWAALPNIVKRIQIPIDEWRKRVMVKTF